VPATIPTILTTDLSLDRDPDDWVDTLLFSTTPGINPIGLILEHYATSEVESETRRFLEYLGAPHLTIKRGIQQRLERQNGSIRASQYHDGAEYIVDTLRRSSGGVRLIVVGSLRNEALAYQMAPELFHRKIECLYFAGGNLTATPECNVSRDEAAAEIVLNAPIPKVWIPACETYKQKLTAADEAAIATIDHPAAALVTEMLARWRAARGEAWLTRTRQLPDQGKNLWSIPAFLHAAGLDEGLLSFARGTLHFSDERKVWFDDSEDGVDLMLKEIDKPRTISWVLRAFQSLQ